MNLKNLKVALVYDRINKWGGAERVLLALHRIFPEASLFTSVCDEANARWVSVFPSVYPSFLQKLPLARRRHRSFGWLMPLVFESFKFDNYDLVISVTSEAAKGIMTKPTTKHLCYMLTPTRYLWSHHDLYFRDPLLRLFSKPVVSYLRYWDKIAAQRPDKLLAISQRVKRRIDDFYNLDSKVVYPPICFGDFDFKQQDNSLVFDKKKYYLVVSRLEDYKKVDLVIEAFRILKFPLVVVGVGSRMNYLKKISSSNIHFVGRLVSDSLIASYYKDAKALIMPQEEDFGLVSLEAQYFGVPVISYRESGAAETIVEGKTGILFDKQNIFSLIDAIHQFDKMNFTGSDFRENLKRFSFDVFKDKMLAEIEEMFSK